MHPGFHPIGRKRLQPQQSGYAMLGFILVLFGLVILGVVLAPNLVPKEVEKKRDQEQRRLSRIATSLVESIQRTQTIPTFPNWFSAVPLCAGLDQTEVLQVNPAFSGDTNLTRVF